MDPGGIGLDDRVALLVLGQQRAERAVHLDPLVIPDRRLAAVLDDAQRSVGEAQGGDGAVDVTDLAQPRIDKRRSDGAHLHDLAVHHEPGEVEVVDRHVGEQAPGRTEVLQGLWRRVP